MTKRLTLLFVCCVAMTAFLTGCGSDSDSKINPTPDAGINDTGTSETGEDTGADAQNDADVMPEAAPDADSEGGTSTGTLTIGFDHVDGGFTVSDGAQVIATKTSADCPESNGYYTCAFELQTGPYVVAFTDVSGFVTPSDEVIALNASGSTVLVDYDPATTYQLTVGINNADGGFTVSHFNVNTSQMDTLVTKVATDCPLDNGFFTCQMSLPIDGGYSVEFSDVPDFITPATVPVDLSQADVTVHVDYLPL